MVRPFGHLLRHRAQGTLLTRDVWSICSHQEVGDVSKSSCNNSWAVGLISHFLMGGAEAEGDCSVFL